MTDATHPRMARGRGLLRSMGVLSALIVASLVLASSASAATTLSTTVNGAGQGTAGAPVPVVATLTTNIDNNGANPPVPVGQTATIVQTFPSEFKSELAGFGSCPEANFDDSKTVAGGPEDPSVSCPANSLVGNGALTNYVLFGITPAAAVKAEKVVLVKNATTGGLSFWVTLEFSGLRISKILPGTVSTNGTGQTVITWNPTGIQPFPGLKLLEFQTAYNANQASLATLEPFSNTGCASGTWAFSSAVTFVGGTPAGQTAEATADCKNLTPPAEGTATIGASSAKASSKGKGRFPVSCSIAGICTGKFEIKATWPKTDNKFVIARGDYSVPAGATTQVAFTLTSKGKKLLESKRNGTLKTGLKLKGTSGKNTSRKFTLKLN